MFCTECGASNAATARFCRACGFQVAIGGVIPSAVQGLSTGGVAAPAAPVLQAEYATFGARALALLIDGLILTGANILLRICATVTLRSVSETDLEAFLLSFGLAVAWLYYAILESSEHQATFGKRRAGIRVTDTSGQRISFGRASWRFFSRLISTVPFGLGFVLALLTNRRQTLHDLMAGCVVVRADTLPSTLIAQDKQPGLTPSTGPNRVAVFCVGAFLAASLCGTVWWMTTRDQPASDEQYKQWLAELRSVPAVPFGSHPVSPQQQTEGAQSQTISFDDFERWRSDRRQVLRAIQSVDVTVLGHKYPLSEFELDGTTDDDRLKEDARRLLTDKGVPVAIVRGGEQTSLAADSLVFEINRSSGSGSDVAFFVQATVREPSRLLRHPNLTWPLEVWSASRMATCNSSDVYATAQTLVAQLVTEFAADWNEARR